METHVVDRLLLENLVPVTSLESLTHGYILNCRCEGKSPQTLAIYQTVLKNFVWYCRKHDFPDIVQNLASYHIRQFIGYLTSENARWGSANPLARKPASQTTAHDYYRALKTFFNWLDREELIQDNPFKNMKPPKTEKKVIQALKPDEIECLLSACSGKTGLDVRNKAVVSMLLDCGLRVAELASLTTDDVDMSKGSIVVRNGKGGKQRVVHVGSKAQKALWRYITLYRRSETNRLFVNRSGEALDANGIKIFIRRLGAKVKIKVHAHKLRHTFAISYLRAGGDVFSLQYLLGHSTLQMTQRYLQSLNADDAINAHRKFSPLDNMEIRKVRKGFNRLYLGDS